jgi:hypothetical protein
VAVAFSILLTALLSADPAKASPPRPAKAKVYVVYVTVVEVDADGNESVLFTPRVQTTGDPAGVTVNHTDGTTFEFNCKLAASDEPALERIPMLPGSKPAGDPSASKASHDEWYARSPKRSKSRDATEPQREVTSTEKAASEFRSVGPTADVYFVRTYDVSEMLETRENATEEDFGPLIQTLKNLAAPDSWTSKTTIRPFPSTRSLVVKQNDAGHKAVAAALEKLHPSKEE